MNGLIRVQGNCAFYKANFMVEYNKKHIPFLLNAWLNKGVMLWSLLIHE